MELVFNLEEDDLGIYDTARPERCNRFSGGVFAGAYGRPLFLETRRHVMGAHFKPGGAFRFLGIPANELVDAHVDVDALWGAHELREQLCLAPTPAERFRVLERALVVRLHKTAQQHRSVRAALDIYERQGGEPTTRDLARQLGLSQRHFIKMFSEQVGVTPKLYGRLQRFQRAAEMTRGSSTPIWADIAATCGYFDQSHLIHEFQTFSGLTPTDFHRLRNDRLLASPPLIR